MKPFIDYLAFSIKQVECAEPAKLDKDFVFDFLKLDAGDFTDIGRKSFYEHCYTSNNINVYQPYDDTALTQGWHVSMTGQGCRYYEQVQKDGEFVDFWREFLFKLRDLNNHGYHIKPSRIDVACDDFDGMLNMAEIWESAVSRHYVSQFRSVEDKGGFNRKLTKEGIGRTIYFGSRKSDTYCRFYDKRMEQIQKHSSDSEKLKELEAIPHWIRMEFEFKKEQAVKIINIICDADNFGQFYAKAVNTYLRFVKSSGDSNVTRRPMADWWKKFVGTIRRAKLSVGQFKSFSFKKMLTYYDKYLTTTVYTILSRMDIAEFLQRTYELAYSRIKTKHKAIMNDVSCSYELTPSMWWDFLNPVNPDERIAYAQ